MRALELTLNISPASRVLDVGGYLMNWTFVKQKPKLTLLNLTSENHREPGISYVRGNGLCLPFPDKSFDLVYSNSVIEHVGDWERQVQFALESRRCGRSYYVQTPYRWFFFEPHLLTPFVHWFPSRIRKKLFRASWRFILAKPTSVEEEDLSTIRLLSEKQMRVLFPDAQIWKERFLGMTKSLIAVRNCEPN
jgi:SAM-dependent methyltransferase